MPNKTARSIMRPTDTCLKADVALDQACDHLTQHSLPGAPVSDESGGLIGYVSVHDCIEQLMQSIYYCDNTALVKDVMTKECITAAPDMSLIDLSTHMTQSKVNALPVVEADKVIGLITRRDVMVALVKELESCAVPLAK